MPVTTKPFGKRQAHRAAASSDGKVGGWQNQRTPPASPVSVLSPEHAAFFAEARQELAEPEHSGKRIVPRTGRAALLAGLVVGCALAGLDANASGGATQAAALHGMLALGIDPANLLPALIALGLLGGARASAMTVTGAHEVLKRLDQPSHAAYAAGGAAASLAFASMLFVFGHVPAHGWMVEALSGAGAGFFYRVFAGSRPA